MRATSASPDTAAIKAAVLAAYPELDLFFRYNAALPGLDHNEAQVVSMKSGRVRGGLHYTAACNHHFQALAADGAKAALFRVSYESYCDYR